MRESVSLGLGGIMAGLWGKVALLLLGLVLILTAIAVAGLRWWAPAPAGATVHLTAAGDYGNSPQAAATLTRLPDLQPDAHIAVGDLAYTDNPEAVWCEFVSSRVGSDFPFQLLAGNHESDGENGDIDQFAQCLPNQIPGVVGTYGRQYYYDLPGDHPVVRVVNVSAGLIGPEGAPWQYLAGSPRYTWTAAAIDGARADGIPWVVVSNHYPCLSVSTYECPMPPDFFTLMQEKRVDLVISGHDHAYLRTHQLASGTEGCPRIALAPANPACIADGDSSFVAGAGTVFVTVGTGGAPLRNIEPNDEEGPYFASTSGANRNPTWGILDLALSDRVLTGQFVATAGGTHADRFVIEKLTPTE